eukprot:c40312_g1_i1 orf=119-1654(+)
MVCAAMTSRFCLYWQTRPLLLLITSYLIITYLKIVHAKGHVGIIKLQHAYADLIASSRKHSGKGMSKEHIELFKAHDRARHGRTLANVVEFPLGGNSNPFVAGIYFTRVRLGNPSKEYYVQVDTGSDLLWLNCSPCTACPRSNNLGMVLVPYDPHTSSTSSPITCKDSMCDHAFKLTNSDCDGTRLCGYNFQYGDGSSTTGYLVADTLIYSTVQSNNTLANSEAKIVFGCGYSQSGNLLTAQNVVDGIMGFGQSKLSVISQLQTQGLTPGVFAHCLQGSDKGGGILVLGNVVEPSMVYTPLLSSLPHYNVNLRAISVSGTPLAIESSAYDTTSVQGTIFDSGTTLAYLMEPAYTSFINAIVKGAPEGAHFISQQGTPCFIYTGSVDEAFPLVTLHFEGADMKLKGSHYLIQQADNVNPQLWCIGWHLMSSSTTVNGVLLTILGDIVLKDQLIVYDLENQRIGWVNYDCSGSIAVSLTSGKSESVSPNVLGNHASGPRVQLSLTFYLVLMTW